MSKKIRPSWESSPGKAPYSPEGIADVRENVREGLKTLYKGIAMSMFRYDFDESFAEALNMSDYQIPEMFLLHNGIATIFRDPLTDDVHIFPAVMYNGINMYGKMSMWRPMPVGNDPESNRIRQLKLSRENAVLIKNDMLGTPDDRFIDTVVDELVNNFMTTRQLQLLAKCPLMFAVTEDNVMTAKNVYLAMASDVPVVFTNALGDGTIPDVISTNVNIDPALFELFDRFECMLLSYLGFPCVPITKRAQQTVSEVQSNDAKLYARRMEKLRMREYACKRCKEVLGVSITVHSVIDEDIAEQAEEDAGGEEHKEEDE